MKRLYNRLTLDELVLVWFSFVAILLPWIVVAAMGIAHGFGLIEASMVSGAAFIAMGLSLVGLLGSMLVALLCSEEWFSNAISRPTRRELTIEKLEDGIKKLEWERDHA
jgi:hypothetical protein